MENPLSQQSPHSSISHSSSSSSSSRDPLALPSSACVQEGASNPPQPPMPLASAALQRPRAAAKQAGSGALPAVPGALQGVVQCRRRLRACGGEVLVARCCRLAAGGVVDLVGLPSRLLGCDCPCSHGGPRLLLSLLLGGRQCCGGCAAVLLRGLLQRELAFVDGSSVLAGERRAAQRAAARAPRRGPGGELAGVRARYLPNAAAVAPAVAAAALQAPAVVWRGRQR